MWLLLTMRPRVTMRYLWNVKLLRHSAPHPVQPTGASGPVGSPADFFVIELETNHDDIENDARI